MPSSCDQTHGSGLARLMAFRAGTSGEQDLWPCWQACLCPLGPFPPSCHHPQAGRPFPWLDYTSHCLLLVAWAVGNYWKAQLCSRAWLGGIHLPFLPLVTNLVCYSPECYLLPGWLGGSAVGWWRAWGPQCAPVCVTDLGQSMVVLYLTILGLRVYHQGPLCRLSRV